MCCCREWRSFCCCSSCCCQCPWSSYQEYRVSALSSQLLVASLLLVASILFLTYLLLWAMHVCIHLLVLGRPCCCWHPLLFPCAAVGNAVIVFLPMLFRHWSPCYLLLKFLLLLPSLLLLNSLLLLV
jgi:hypothetical protein